MLLSFFKIKLKIKKIKFMEVEVRLWKSLIKTLKWGCFFILKKE